MRVPPLPRAEKDHFLKAYTRGLNTTDLGRLFTRDAPDAYRFFSRGIDFLALQKLPWHKRAIGSVRMLFLAFTMRLTPARRLIYGISLVTTLIGLMELYREMHFLLVPHPAFAPGTM